MTEPPAAGVAALVLKRVGAQADRRQAGEKLQQRVARLREQHALAGIAQELEQPGVGLAGARGQDDVPRVDGEADLLAIVVARDPRGVTEFVYLGGGVYRRGFVDPTQPEYWQQVQQI